MAQKKLSSLPPEMFDHYADPVHEDGRLFGGNGPLELERTKPLITRYLTAQPQVVRDVGGGTGIYAHWLAGLGHETHLLDAVPSLVNMAKSKTATGVPLASAQDSSRRVSRCFGLIRTDEPRSLRQPKVWSEGATSWA